jgi:hypothetical protein
LPTISAQAGRSWGCVSAIDSSGRTIWIADAHRDDGKHFVVHADENLTAFIELESVIRAAEPTILKKETLVKDSCGVESNSLKPRRTTA